MVGALLVAPLAACQSYRLAAPELNAVAAMDPPPTGLGQICVFRPSVLAAAVTFVIRDNGTLVGATRARDYFCYYAKPGEHVLAVGAAPERGRCDYCAGGGTRSVARSSYLAFYRV